MDDRHSRHGSYLFETFELDPLRRTLSRDGGPILLTPTVFELLVSLVERAGSVVTKDELYEAVWGGRIVEEANLRQTMSTLRRALAPDGDRLIATAPGRGYRFVGEVRRREHGRAPAIGTLIPRRLAAAAPVPVVTALLAVALIIVPAIGLWRWRSAAAPLSVSVALADFENRTGEGVFDRTLSDRLRIDLAQSPVINAMSDKQQRDAIAATGKPRDGAVTLPLARTVCASARADAVVDGTIVQAAPGYALTLDATRCDGTPMAIETEHLRRREDVPAMLDQLVARLRGDLGESARSLARFGIPAGGTPSLAALKAYAEANWLVSHGEIAGALPLDRTAIELDPGFALAYAHMGIAYESMMDPDRGAAALDRAYRLRARLPERERLRIIALHDQFVTRDAADTLADLRTWTMTYPSDAIAWANLANQEQDLGLRAAAARDASTALALQPPLQAPYAILMRAEMGLGRYAAVRRTAALAERRGLSGPNVHRELLRVAIAAQDRPAIAGEERWASAQPDALFIQGVEAEYTLALGQLRNARARFEALRRRFAEQGAVDPYVWDFAMETALLGSDEEGRRLLGAAAGRPSNEGLIAQGLTGVPATGARIAGTIAEAGRAAAVALAQHRPAEAIADLRPTLASFHPNLNMPYLLGIALLADHQPAKAADVFAFMLAHRGWYPETVLYPMAQLGLAEALAADGRTIDAGRAYEALFAMWRDADADFPPLIRARRDYRLLRR